MTYELILPEQVPPEALDGRQLPEGCIVSAAVEDGKVVGVWCAMMVLHAEPLWVHPEYRKHPKLLPRLWENLKRMLKEAGAKQAVSVVLDANQDTVRLAQWVGAEKLPGSVYFLNLEKPCLRQ